MRRPIWTECECGWSSGHYLIEKLSHDFWVLSRGNGLDAQILTSASSASELEAFSTVHHRVGGAKRPLLLGLGYMSAIAGVVVGSLLGSTLTVAASSLLTVLVVAKFSEYLTGRRLIRSRMPASVG
ncbi:MAG TPA: hypothetical protein VF115_08330 [Acidimicrobiia bacterium]